MKKFTLLSICLAVWCMVSAQNYDSRIAPTKTDLDQVEMVLLPALNNEALLEAELERRGPGIAPRFAEVIDVNITPESHGLWEELSNEEIVWRLRIRSNDAYALNLGFTQYFMPEGGSLILYSPDRKHVMGPFTPSDNEEHEQLWTPIFDGEEIVLEVKLPKTSREDLNLVLTRINHDFIGFSQMASGSCNLDVICGEADGWGIVDMYRDIIQSVAVYGTGGGTFCTGFLINSTREDCTPYFMTAAHCGLNSGNAPSLVTYWNFQNSACRQPNSPASGGNGNGTLNDFNSGAIFRAGYAPTDFTLLELDDPVSPTANAFFAGWSAVEETTVDTVIAVHHPSTDEKRISFEFDPTYRGTWGNGAQQVPTGNHIIVPDWDIGTTEGGSSGSPLFDHRKRVIGQLHGGGAACGNNSYDSYGWIHSSWEGGGTPSSRLKDWLDPDNTGVLTLDGRWELLCNFFVAPSPATQELCAPDEITYTLEVSETFTSAVTINLENVPNGVDAVLSTNPVTPGESVELRLGGTDQLADGVYTINIMGMDEVESAESEVSFTIFTAIPEVNTLMSPADEEEGVATAPTLQWMAQSPGTVYTVEVATDEGFTQIVTTLEDLNEPMAVAPGLEAISTYFWRVRSSNICGQSDWSEPFQFTTAAIICNAASSLDVPTSITTSGTPTINSSLEIPLSGTVSDVRVVGLEINHSWVGDLEVALISPAGTSVVLFSRPGTGGGAFGCDGDNLSLGFDDEATATATDLQNSCGNQPAIQGTFQPLNPLSAFNGENLTGTWTLRVTDNADQDGGSLIGWGLDFCSTIPNDLSLNTSISEADLCTAESVSFEILLGTAFGENGVQLTSSGLPDGTAVTFSENPAFPGANIAVTVENIPTAGDYQLLIEGTDGTNQAINSVDFTVGAPPAATILSEPLDASEDQAITGLVLNWEAILEADNYILQISTTPDMSTVAIEETTPNKFFEISGLDYATTYYWQVTTVNDCGSTTSEMIYSFTTVPDLNFSASPGSQTACQADNPSFQLNVSEGYGEDASVSFTIEPEVEVDISYDFADGTPISGTSFNATINNLFSLTPGDYTIQFTVADSENSNTIQVQLAIEAAPGIPTLVSPVNGALLVEQAPLLSWEAIPNASSYFVELARDDAFTVIVGSSTVTSNSFPITSPLDGGIYYWRATANNDCGGATPEAFNFTIQASSTSELNGSTIQIAPNPTKSWVAIQLSQPLTGSTQVQLYNISGQQLQNKILPTTSTAIEIDLSNYPAGVYLIRMQNQGKLLTKRIILQ